ncbi:MAG: ribokinase [Chloroflexi bacterium]|nr:ribokinase [Chloroflexota bacterium]
MRGSQAKITVVGSFAVGLTLRAPRFPVAGETLIGSDFDMGPGGKGSNQAVGSARLGAESHLVAVVGTDMFGDVGVNLYRQEGVGIEHLRRAPERNTGVGFILLNEAGENEIVLDMGANHLLSPEDVDRAEALIASSDVVMSVLEISPETAARAMALATKHGLISILNPAPAQPLGDVILANVDVLTPNESELRILSGLAPDDPTDTLDLAHRLQKRGVRQVVVTLGRNGALIVNEDGSTAHVPGQKVDVVDTTGAGDAFTCALGVALAEGKPLKEAARFATCAGALACTKLGVIPALARREEVEQLMQTA